MGIIIKYTYLQSLYRDRIKLLTAEAAMYDFTAETGICPLHKKHLQRVARDKKTDHLF